MQSSKKIIVSLALILLAVVAGIYFFPEKSLAPKEIPDENITENPQDLNPTTEKDFTLGIMVPQDVEVYKKQMIEFVQAGGTDPLEKTVFVEKKINVEITDELMKASAQIAAQQIQPGGGPEKVLLEYFKLENRTAYVLLNIDLDGWAGVSVSLAMIHPLVEKTLLQFPEIDQVIFEYAPEEPVKNL